MRMIKVFGNIITKQGQELLIQTVSNDFTPMDIIDKMHKTISQH